MARSRPAADRSGAHHSPRQPWPFAVGDAFPAEDRPDRLPLADKAIHRPACRVPVRRPSRGRGRGRKVRRHALRHRGRVLEPSGAKLAPSTRCWPSSVLPHRPSTGLRPSSAAPTRRALTLRRSARGCWPHRWGFRECTPMISHSSKQECRSTTPSIVGPAMPPARRTIGPRPAEKPNERANSLSDLGRGNTHMGAYCRAFLRRSGGPDCGHASHPRRGETLAWRRPVPACAQFLHASAGPRGAAACNLYRLADARGSGRTCRGPVVHRARYSRHHGVELGLCNLGETLVLSRPCSSA